MTPRVMSTSSSPIDREGCICLVTETGNGSNFGSLEDVNNKKAIGSTKTVNHEARKSRAKKMNA